MVSDFRQAWEVKDIKALIGLLDPDVLAVTDSGGIVSAAAPHPVQGSEEVARVFVDLGSVAGVSILECGVNGRPGLVVQREGIALSVLAFAVADGRIQRIWAVRNPHRLRPWTV